MHLNSEMKSKSVKICPNSIKVYPKLRKFIVKLWNSDKFLLNSSSSLNLRACDTLP